MPFIQQNIDPRMIRGSSRSGRLSSMQQDQNLTMPDSHQRARSQLSNTPRFQQNITDKLFSQPFPEDFRNQNNQDDVSLFVDSAINKDQVSKVGKRGLQLPLEYANETAYLHRQQKTQESEFVRPNSSLGNLGAQLNQRRLQKPQIGVMDPYASDQPLTVNQMIPTELPRANRARTAVAGGDRVKFHQQKEKKTEEDVLDIQKKQQLDQLDFTKRLEKQSQTNLGLIKSSKSVSQFGRILENKMPNILIQKPPTIGSLENPTEHNKLTMNDWIMKSRAGTATNVTLKKQANDNLFGDVKQVVKEDIQASKMYQIKA